jgi:hypothetical protein
MKYKGKQLEFISFIKRDGTGTLMIGGDWDVNSGYPKTGDMSYLDEDVFEVNCLSLSSKTFIASGFNSFVVKIR